MKPLDLLKCCLNWKVLLGIGGVMVLLLIFLPGQLAAFAPFLLLLICPLSMGLMMFGMKKMGNSCHEPNCKEHDHKTSSKEA